MYGHGGGAYGIHVVRDGFRVEVVEESDDGTVEEVGEEEEELVGMMERSTLGMVPRIVRKKEVDRAKMGR
jgi:hypothetical protein